MMASSAPLPVALSAAACQERAQGPAPALRRRMAAFVYEGVLLFGVLMMVGMVYSISINQRHALHGRPGMMAVVFLTLAAYFIWFWTHGGQTLAMKTWRLKLVSEQGAAITLPQALKRYMASWLWFMPAFYGAWLMGWHQSKLLYGVMGSWMVLYTALTWLLPQGQFLHDIICRTRVIDTRD